MTDKTHNEESKERYCLSCKKDTRQRIKLYDPDDIESQQVYECIECGETVDFLSGISLKAKEQSGEQDKIPNYKLDLLYWEGRAQSYGCRNNELRELGEYIIYEIQYHAKTVLDEAIKELSRMRLFDDCSFPSNETERMTKHGIFQHNEGLKKAIEVLTKLKEA